MKEVIVYSTPICPYCGMVKTYLMERGVQFREHDISADKGKAREMVTKSKQNKVPVIDINGTIVVGFNRRRIDEALSGSKKIKVPKSNMFFDFMDQ